MADKRTGDRLADMLGSLQGQGKPVTGTASEPSPTVIPIGEKATERPEDAQDAAAGFKTMREALGWSIVDTSAFLRVPPRTLYAWEDGTMLVNPTAWTLLQVLTKFPAARKWVAPPAPGQGRFGKRKRFIDRVRDA